MIGNLVKDKHVVLGLNLFLKGASILPKFLFILYIGKFITFKLLGIFSIFSTTILICTFLVGLDFYSFVHRELIKFNIGESFLNILLKQLTFYGVVYIIIFPFLYLIFYYSIIDIKYIIWFYLILIFEHLSQELFRTFILIGKTTFANFLYFIRTGLWTGCLIILWHFNIINKTFENILIFWLISSIVSTIYPIMKLVNEYSSQQNNKINLFEIKWYWEGVKVCILFFFTTIFYKLIEYLGRYLLEYYYDEKTVGIYSLLSNIANVINVVIDTTIISFLYPLLLKYYNEKNTVEFNKIKNKMLSQVCYTSVFLVIFFWFGWDLLLIILNKSEVADFKLSFTVMLLGNLFLNISFVYHYCIYAKKQDEGIFITTLIGFFVTIILLLIFTKNQGVLGVAVSTCLGFFTILISKWFFLKWKQQ